MHPGESLTAQKPCMMLFGQDQKDVGACIDHRQAINGAVSFRRNAAPRRARSASQPWRATV